MLKVNHISPQKKISLHVPSLTGIRIVAAYLVFFHHFNPLHELKTRNLAAAFINPLFEEGHIGVTIFFVLSGLLITMRYYDSVKVSKSWFLNYMRNRIARIYPLYFIVTIITFVLIYYNPAYDVAKLTVSIPLSQRYIMVLTNLTLTKGLFASFKFTGVSQGWTLTVEEMFYLAAPLLLLGLRGDNKRIIFYPIIIIAIGISINILLHTFLLPFPLFGLLSDIKFIFNYTFFGRCFEFTCGMCLALQLAKNHSYGRRYAIFLTYMGILWIIVCVYALNFVKGGSHISTDTILGIIINNIILPIGISCLFLGLINGKTLVERFLANNFMQLLGKSSYAFYLIHMGVLNVVIDKFIKSNFIINFIIINFLSIVIFWLIEEPLHKRIKY